MAAPTEPQIVEAVKSHLKSDTNSLTESDLPRLLATLELENDWSDITLKRFTSILTKHSILAPNSARTSAPSSNPTNTTSSSSKKKKKSKTDAGVPKSYIDSSIPYPPGIQGVYFDPVRGKGLISTRPFAEGELLFTEEAYIPTPPPEALDQVTRGELCGQCFLPVSSAPVQLAIKSCKACKYRFCTSACWRSAMATHHNLLCVGLNPGARDLMALVQGHKWQSLHCVARSLARLMSTLTPHNNTPWRSGKGAEEEDLLQIYGDFETVFARLTSFATVSELERRSRNPGWATEKSSFEPLLAQAHSALRLALDPYLDNNTAVAHDTSSSPTQVAIENINSTRKNHIKDLFTHPTFLKLLGRANINMEKFGGLYSLHSFLNHSCSPNVQIRHVPSRGILSSMHVAALALRPIAKDEELVISYIDPNTRLGRRQLLLYRDYCFGPCICDKCKDELKQMGLEYDSSKHGVRGFLDSVAKKTGETAEHETNKQNPQEDASLEEELRASLGF
ncbi:probable Potential protein lysine methyltransferase SET5 [Ustilago trichophora]|uniref:Histone-lysine N-methyltransferase SET5 n=1 Tax=Ustilago trichophora TaxID=86804 RepID=A0A5C3EQK3_9BASI|nr:probable Potential protein lysine methyltransferase SET5 [Ustilago trichophora]